MEICIAENHHSGTGERVVEPRGRLFGLVGMASKDSVAANISNANLLSLVACVSVRDYSRATGYDMTRLMSAIYQEIQCYNSPRVSTTRIGVVPRTAGGIALWVLHFII